MRPALDGRRATRDLARLYGPPPGQNDDAPIAANDRGAKVAHRHTVNPNHSTSRLPNNWRGRLPAPATWYALNVPSMVIKDGVGTAPCPMHADTRRSFLVRLDGVRGTWNCPTCGHGDMVAFVMRLHGVGFVAAVRHLVLGSAA